VNRRGFTLVEALLTVVIAGLLAMLGFPTFARTLSSRAAWNARAVAIGMYAQARASATETGRATTLQWTGNTAVITASPRLNGGSGVDTIGSPRNFDLMFGVSVSGSPGTVLSIDPRGLGTSASTTIFFVRNGTRDSILVTGYGRVVK
jgi:prepilin-type N-terminal cleavage/methylation domain-containing protein